MIITYIINHNATVTFVHSLIFGVWLAYSKHMALIDIYALYLFLICPHCVVTIYCSNSSHVHMPCIIAIELLCTSIVKYIVCMIQCLIRLQQSIINQLKIDIINQGQHPSTSSPQIRSYIPMSRDLNCHLDGPLVPNH
jgi:hypothetical protein